MFITQVPVLLYHGTSTERLMLKQKLMEMVKSSQEIVVITSYEILLRDKGALQVDFRSKAFMNLLILVSIFIVFELL